MTTNQQSQRRGGTNLPMPPALPPTSAKDEGVGDLRYRQLADERGHKFMADENRKELLNQKLERLRALKDEIAKDEWMFDSQK